jgi:hypothetical protein
LREIKRMIFRLHRDIKLLTNILIKILREN